VSSLGSEVQQRFWHYRECASRAGEAALFGKAAKFDGAIPHAWDFVDRVGNPRFGDVGLVSRIVENNGSVFQRIIHPLRKLFSTGNCAGGIVRITKIYNIDPLWPQIRHNN